MLFKANDDSIQSETRAKERFDSLKIKLIDLASHSDSVKTTLKSAKATIVRLDSLLTPFVTLSMKMYPEEDSIQAVGRLYNQITATFKISVEQRNQTYIDKLEIHSDANPYLGVEGNFSIQINHEAKVVLVRPTNGVWEKPFIGVPTSEPEYELFQYSLIGISMGSLQSSFTFSVGNRQIEVYGVRINSPPASEESPLSIRYKTNPPKQIVFGSGKHNQFRLETIK